MKKIVALVLCLALALSLCTVAFAKTGDLKVINTGATAYSDVDVTVKADKANEVNTKKGTIKEGNVAYFAVDYTANGTDDAYYVVDDTGATHNLVLSDGSKYRVRVATATEIFYDFVATKVTDVENDTCGSMKTDATTYVTYTDEEGDMHLAAVDTNNTTGHTQVLLNGEVKTVTEAPVTAYVHHDWEWIDADDDNKFDAGEIVKCSECGATSKVYDNDTAAVSGAIFEALDGKLAGKYAAAVYSFTGAGAAGNKTETVESAKTFDAGIALYAGMALASVAGSAVVIGKKKEF